MKERASFTFDKETIRILDGLMKSGEYRNKSHVVEYAIRVLGSSKLNFRKSENLKIQRDVRKLKDFFGGKNE